MIHRVPITEARRHLGALVRRLHHKGEYFILEKDGIPVAAVMDPDELDDYLDLQRAPGRAQDTAGKAWPFASSARLTPSCRVYTAPAFDRLLRKLVSRHPDLIDRYAAVLTILETDPTIRAGHTPSRSSKETATES